MKKLLTTKD